MKTIERLQEDYPQASSQLATWAAVVKAARWTDPSHFRETAPFHPRTLQGERVSVKIRGND